jgi:methyl-accepting chemotaxis protein
MMRAGGRLQEEALWLVEASRAARPSERGTTPQIEGDNRQLRILAQIAAGKLEELITQTYIGGHEKMKLVVDNLAVALQGLQVEMARLTEASPEGQLAERGEAGQSLGIHKLLLVLDPERTANLAIKGLA